MSVNTIIKFLITFGVILIVFAMTMDTSVSTGYGRVHNIGLVSQQQNMLLVGGLAFLAGIILFATKQKPQSSEETVEPDKKFQDSVDPQIEKVDQFFRALPDQLFLILDRWITTKRDNILGRVAVVLYTAPLLLVASPLILLLGLYAFRPVPAIHPIIHVLYLHMALDLIFAVGIAIEGLPIALTFICIALAAVSYSIIRFVKHRESAKVTELAS